MFPEGLNFPNGVLAWDKGALINATPDIIYAEDTTGDGHADLRKVLFNGLNHGNQQHRMTGFTLELYNWIHAANGDSGGTITSMGINSMRWFTVDIEQSLSNRFRQLTKALTP